MAYKDVDRQREACRLGMQKLRAKRKGITAPDKGITKKSDKGITVIPSVIPQDVIPDHGVPVGVSYMKDYNIKRHSRPPLTKELQLSRKGFN